MDERLTSIPGIGAFNTTTSLVAALGDAQTFARTRDFAAWLGLVARQATTDGKPRLRGINKPKPSNKYLRKMLIQSARAALPTLSRGSTRLDQWLRGLSRELIPATSSSPSWRRWRVLSGRCCGTAKHSSNEQSLFEREIDRLYSPPGR